MFYALRLADWSQHAFTRLTLGIREDGVFSKTRGVLPDIIRGYILAGLFVGGAYLWRWKLANVGGYSHWNNLVPLLLTLSPIPLAFIMGFTRAWAAARSAKNDSFVRALCSTTTDQSEMFHSFVVGVAFKSLIFLSCYFQALICLMVTDTAIFSRGSSPAFLFLIATTSLFLGGALVLDYSILLALREHRKSRGGAVAILLVLPLRLLQVLGVLLFGAAIGGLAFMASRIDKLENELEGEFFSPEQFEDASE